MSALLNLCNSALKPVDRAAEFTKTGKKKKISKTEVSARQSANALCRTYTYKPFYSPIWIERSWGKGRKVMTIRFKNGYRWKLCPRCKRWKHSDTENFSPAPQVKTGLASSCRQCIRDKQNLVKRRKAYERQYPELFIKEGIYE